MGVKHWNNVTEQYEIVEIGKANYEDHCKEPPLTKEEYKKWFDVPRDQKHLAYVGIDQAKFSSDWSDVVEWQDGFRRNVRELINAEQS